MSKLKIALAGNPNSGKTTIFNRITGANQKTGNYPGVTVEQKEGHYKFEGDLYDVIDLPGIYSLSPNSPEEIIARDVIIESKPDLTVNIIDASNLERNLYLSSQLKEMNVPLLLVFNMWDIVEKEGIKIDIKKISEYFGADIVTVSGISRDGSEIIKAAIKKNLNIKHENHLKYSEKAESVIKETESIIADKINGKTGVSPRWFSVKVLEKDPYVSRYLNKNELIQKQLSDKIEEFEKSVGEKSDIYFADQRYEVISEICGKFIKRDKNKKKSVSDKIDAVVTNTFLGIPIFLILMYFVFKLTFVVGDPFMGMIETFFGYLGDVISGLWPEGSESLLRSLIVDGVIGGVGGVVVFLPNIILLFLAIAILEGTGYMSRAAFIMDRLMRALGLHGNSFIPMLIGFGCTVPAIMATRTLANKKDRFTTIMVSPLMSCGARLPIYALIIPAFFSDQWQARILWIVYFTGILLAIIAAKVLRSTVFKGEVESFVMELPPYKFPTVRSILMQMWTRAGIYLKKAGTIILAISIIMWVLAVFPRNEAIGEKYEAKIAQVNSMQISDEAKSEKIQNLEFQMSAEEMAYTVTGRFGKVIEPIIKPLGFDWRIGAAMVGAFAAKEVFVAQLGVVYSVGEADEESDTLRDKLKDNYNALQAFAIMIFALISAPCMATIAITKRETNSWKWAAAQLIGLTVLAYLITLLVYQGGLLLGFGAM